MDPAKLARIRAATLSGWLPEGLTQQDVEEYSEDLLADYDRLAGLYGSKEARRRLRHQLLALKRAEGAVPIDRVRALIREAEEEGLF
jgi:hypothetical protein